MLPIEAGLRAVQTADDTVEADYIVENGHTVETSRNFEGVGDSVEACWPHC